MSIQELIEQIQNNVIKINHQQAYLNYQEYKRYSLLVKRKYRKSWKDIILKIPIIGYLAFLRAKHNFYNNHYSAEYLQDFRNHFLEHVDQYIALYNLLFDQVSKDVLIELLRARFTHDYRPALSNFPQYFEKDIIHFKDNEVFVDCGAWVGDSTDMFLQLNPHPNRKCYVIEPDKYNMKQLKKVLNNQNGDFVFIQSCIGDKKDNVFFNELGDSGSSIGAFGKQKIEVDTIDNILQERPTFIKMDLEGFELQALKGSRKQISKNPPPTLAISIYHKPDDFISIIEYIKTLDVHQRYRFFIRHYSPMSNETILYAIPS